MWIRWILQNQWPWLLLCPVGFSAKPQGGADVQAVPHYPTPFPWECCSVWGMGTAAASRYFSWGIAGSLQLPSGGFLTPWSSWKELEPFPGCSNRFSCCSIPSLPAPSLPCPGLCLCRCCRSPAGLGSCWSRSPAPSQVPSRSPARGSSSTQCLKPGPTGAMERVGAAAPTQPLIPSLPSPLPPAAPQRLLHPKTPPKNGL